MSDSLFVVGFCPSCETGPLGVRICGACGRPHVLCEECDALWLSRDTTQPAIFPQQPDVPCSACGFSLQQGPSHWASWQELVQLNWQPSVVAQGTVWSAETTGARRETDLPVAHDERDGTERAGGCLGDESTSGGSNP